MQIENENEPQTEMRTDISTSDLSISEPNTQPERKAFGLSFCCRERKTKLFSKAWFKKYFCRGQINKFLEYDDKGPAPEGSSWFYRNFIWRRNRFVCIFSMFTILFTIWIIGMAATNGWWIFRGDSKRQIKPGWEASVTMIFGSLIGGATAEGGGAVAYPVFTLALKVKPIVARDFTLMIQTVGMGAAAIIIQYMEILQVDLAIVYCTIGGVFGLIVGIAWMVPKLTPSHSKLFFVSFFLAFAINLFLLNCHRGRYTRKRIKNPWLRDYLILLVTGFAGGLVSSVSGTGIDITIFSVLTLVYRIDEKVATPTTVTIQAINTAVGFLYVASRGTIEEQTWVFFGSACWVVCLGAPFGAFLSSFVHRQVLACIIYLLDVAQFIAACVIVKFEKSDYYILFFTLFGAIFAFMILRLIGYLFFINSDDRPQENRTTSSPSINLEEVSK